MCFIFFQDLDSRNWGTHEQERRQEQNRTEDRRIIIIIQRANSFSLETPIYKL
jgi:hypothetical protein